MTTGTHGASILNLPGSISVLGFSVSELPGPFDNELDVVSSISSDVASVVTFAAVSGADICKGANIDNELAVIDLRQARDHSLLAQSRRLFP